MDVLDRYVSPLLAIMQAKVLQLIYRLISPRLAFVYADILQQPASQPAIEMHSPTDLALRFAALTSRVFPTSQWVLQVPISDTVMAHVSPMNGVTFVQQFYSIKFETAVRHVLLSTAPFLGCAFIYLIFVVGRHIVRRFARGAVTSNKHEDGAITAVVSVRNASDLSLIFKGSFMQTVGASNGIPSGLAFVHGKEAFLRFAAASGEMSSDEDEYISDGSDTSNNTVSSATALALPQSSSMRHVAAVSAEIRTDFQDASTQIVTDTVLPNPCADMSFPVQGLDQMSDSACAVLIYHNGDSSSSSAAIPVDIDLLAPPALEQKHEHASAATDALTCGVLASVANEALTCSEHTVSDEPAKDLTSTAKDYTHIRIAQESSAPSLTVFAACVGQTLPAEALMFTLEERGTHPDTGMDEYPSTVAPVAQTATVCDNDKILDEAVNDTFRTITSSSTQESIVSSLPAELPQGTDSATSFEPNGDVMSDETTHISLSAIDSSTSSLCAAPTSEACLSADAAISATPGKEMAVPAEEHPSATPMPNSSLPVDDDREPHDEPNPSAHASPSSSTIHSLASTPPVQQLQVNPPSASSPSSSRSTPGSPLQSRPSSSHIPHDISLNPLRTLADVAEAIKFIEEVLLPVAKPFDRHTMYLAGLSWPPRHEDPVEWLRFLVEDLKILKDRIQKDDFRSRHIGQRCNNIWRLRSRFFGGLDEWKNLSHNFALSQKIVVNTLTNPPLNYKERIDDPEEWKVFRENEKRNMVNNAWPETPMIHQFLQSADHRKAIDRLCKADKNHREYFREILTRNITRYQDVLNDFSFWDGPDRLYPPQ